MSSKLQINLWSIIGFTLSLGSVSPLLASNADEEEFFTTRGTVTTKTSSAEQIEDALNDPIPSSFGTIPTEATNPKNKTTRCASALALPSLTITPVNDDDAPSAPQGPDQNDAGSAPIILPQEAPPEKRVSRNQKRSAAALGNRSPSPTEEQAPTPTEADAEYDGPTAYVTTVLTPTAPPPMTLPLGAPEISIPTEATYEAMEGQEYDPYGMDVETQGEYDLMTWCQ